MKVVGLKSLLNLLRFILSMLRHPLNRGQPVKTIGRYLVWQIGSRLLRQPVLYPFVNDLRMLVATGFWGAPGVVYFVLENTKTWRFAREARVKIHRCAVGAIEGQVHLTSHLRAANHIVAAGETKPAATVSIPVTRPGFRACGPSAHTHQDRRRGLRAGCAGRRPGVIERRIADGNNRGGCWIALPIPRYLRPPLTPARRRVSAAFAMSRNGAN